MKLSDLATRIHAQLIGDGNLEVGSVNTLEDAAPGELSFLANPRYARHLDTTRATAVICSPTITSDRIALLRSSHPYHAYCQALILLHGHRRHPHTGIHPKATIEPSAVVGEGSTLYPGVYVGPRARIGKDCVLYPNAVVYDDCILGDRVILHAGAVIGQDGFGYSTHKGQHYKIPHTGNVILQDDVEVGPNTCIARSAMGATTIGQGTKIDALAMIGHNVRIGEHGMIVAQTGIAGSTSIGHHVTLAARAGIAGHLRIGDNVTVGGRSSVLNDVDDQSVIVGSPAMPAMQARRVYSLFTQLPDLVDRIKKLESQIAELGVSDEPTGI